VDYKRNCGKEQKGNFIGQGADQTAGFFLVRLAGVPDDKLG
jgi:hypothetical protein